MVLDNLVDLSIPPIFYIIVKIVFTDFISKRTKNSNYTPSKQTILNFGSKFEQNLIVFKLLFYFLYLIKFSLILFIVFQPFFNCFLLNSLKVLLYQKNKKNVFVPNKSRKYMDKTSIQIGYRIESED